MKKNCISILAGLSLFALLALTGCYTQLARPDRGEEPAVSAEAEAPEEIQQEARYPHETNVYIYGSYGYPYHWWYDPFWRPYAPWRTGVYVRVGYSDPWDWCGTPWYWDCDWYFGWSAGWPHYYPYYYPRYYSGAYYYYDGDYRHPVKQRSFGRRGSSSETPGVYGAGTKNSRPSLAKARPVVYTRDAKGALQRRVRRESVGEIKRGTPGRETLPPVKREGASDRRQPKKQENINKDSGAGTSSGGAKSGGGSGYTRTRKQSPPANSGGSSSPPAKRSSGGSVSKPSNSGSSGSSGNSGSSNRGSGSSSGGSNRRTRP